MHIPPLVIKASHASGSAFCICIHVHVYINIGMLEQTSPLVVED